MDSAKLNKLIENREKAMAGGGEAAVEKHHAKGKRQVLFCEPRFPLPEFRTGPDQSHERHTKASSQVQEAGHHGGRRVLQQRKLFPRLWEPE